MVLVGFSVVGNRVSAGTSDATDLPESSTVYAPGTALTTLADGRTRVQYLPTFQRWDGEWRPTREMNRTTGEWPYRIDETPDEVRITRLGETLTQAKLPGAIYEYLADGVKETFVLTTAPPAGRISVPFSSTLSVTTVADRISLRAADGMESWGTSPWHAWDSGSPIGTWGRPVVSLAYEAGLLTVHLDEKMLATAAYPLFVDPTWVINPSNGWGSGTLTDLVEDLGDSNLRIGWLADNFNDGTKDLFWTIWSGSWWIDNGAAKLNTTSSILSQAQAGQGKWDTSLQAKITITATGSGTQLAKMLFRWQTSAHHFVEIDEKNDRVAIKKTVSGSTITFCSALVPGGIATNTPYTVKLNSTGGTHVVLWNGAVLCTGTDPSPPSPSLNKVGFETVGTKMKISVDDVRAWTTDAGHVLTDVREPTWPYWPNAMRSIHTTSAYGGVDLRILSSADNVTWGDPHHVKAGAKSQSSDADSYSIQDADRQPYYRARVDLRTTDDGSPALAEAAVFEGGLNSSDNSQVLGYEPWQYYVGNLVNAVDGNLVLRATDLAVPGKGWPLAFARAYNSLASGSGPLGVGWTHAYNASLTSGSGIVSFTDGDGSTHVFQDTGGGTYSSPRGLGGTKLVRNGDNTYTMFGKDGSRSSFTAAGKLSQMTDRNGNKLTMTYDGNGRLTRVADDSGIFLVLSYDANGRIARVGDHNTTLTWANFSTHSGNWSSGGNAVSSNNVYATSSTNGALHTFATFGLTGPGNAWITKVEACVEAYTLGDDDLGVKISTDGGQSWSAEQVVNLPTSDPDALTCLDFTSHASAWTWSLLGDPNLQVRIRYVKVGGQAAQDRLDWIVVRVSSASRFVSYAYDGSGRLTTVTDALGASDLFTYASIMDKHVDRADKVLRFVRDNSLRVKEVWTGEYNRTTSSIQWEFRMYSIAFGNWANNRKATVTDALGNVTEIEYDRLAGRPIRIEGPLAAAGGGCSCCGAGGSERWELDWDGEHNWVSRADGLGHTTDVAVDWRGNLLRETDALGNYTENAWQNRDNGTLFDSLLVTQRNKRAFVTTNEYDWKGNTIKTTDAMGNFTRTFYTSAGFINKTTDKRGFNTTHAYDAHGWRLNTTDPLGHTTRLEYDAAGRIVKTTTTLNFVSRTAYNGNDWVVSDVNPLNFVTRYEYNGRGDRTVVVDANGNRTTTVVNVTWAKAQKTIEATGDTDENTYNRLGRLVQVKDPRGKIWRYDFDKFGRQTNVTDPLNQKTRHAYDAAGNVVQRIDGNGKYTNYTLYDALNRLRTVAYQDGNTLTYAYDANSNRISETGYGFTRTTEYDALDRVKKVTFNFGSFSKIVQYTYDENGNRKTMAYPDGFTVTYVWDAGSRLSNIQITGQTWTFLYDNDNRRTAARHPNGLELNATYDQASRLTDVRSKNLANGSTVESFTYTHDNIANRKSLTHMNATYLSFAYEDDYALNRTTYESGSAAYYAYDANDNRLFRNESGNRRIEYAYGADSSISGRTWFTGSTATLDEDFLYDANGNVKTRIFSVLPVPPGETTIYSYTYDLENRFVQIKEDGIEQASYAYFPDGSRIRKTASGTTTNFLYDFRDFNGFNDILEEYDGAGNRVARFIHGPGIDEPLAMERGGSWYYYHFDGLGSVTMLTRSDKTIANRYVYDDFGGFRSKTEAVTNPYGFTGRETDVLGLAFYRARYYDTTIGRFLTRDPARMVDGPNAYAYAGNNPVSRTDPSGLTSHLGYLNTYIPCPISWFQWGSFQLNWDKFALCIYPKTFVQLEAIYLCVAGLVLLCGRILVYALWATFTGQWWLAGALWAAFFSCAFYVCSIAIITVLFICAVSSMVCR